MKEYFRKIFVILFTFFFTFSVYSLSINNPEYDLYNSLEDKNINGLGTINCSDFVLNMVTEQMTSYYIDFNITQFA